MADRSERPSGWMYIVAIAIMFGGCGASLGITLSRASSAVESMQRMLVPGEQEFQLEARSYTLFWEPRSVVDGEAIINDKPGNLRCAILDQAGNEVELTNATVKKTYSFGSYEGESLFELDIDEAGAYRLICTMRGQAAESSGAIAIGDGFSMTGLIIGIGAALAFVAIGMVLIVRTRRRRKQTST